MPRLPAPLALAAALLAATAAPLPAQESAASKVLTIITSPEPQTQLMALILTNAAMQRGAAARVMLCGPGGDIALSEPPAAAVEPLAPQGMSPHGLMVRLMEAGVPVDVCAIYLPNRGAGPEVLSEGVGVTMPPAIAEAMLDPMTTVLSF